MKTGLFFTFYGDDTKMNKPVRYAVWTSMYEDDAAAISLNKIAYYCGNDQDILKGKPEKDRLVIRERDPHKLPCI